MAVLKSRQIVLGYWEMADPWFSEEDAGWKFVLADPNADNVDDVKGRTPTFAQPYRFRRLGYSPDLR